MTLTLCAPLRNVDDARELAYLTIAAVLNTLDEQGKYAVLELVNREYPNAWPMEGDDDGS
jgi:hypothetical protein